MYSSCLIEQTDVLVMDTSVLINLHGSTYGARIISAVPNRLCIPEIVLRELNNETSRSNGETSFVEDLVASGKVTVATLDDREYELFASLASAESSIDDGEAATIAVAACRHYLPVIDDRKGRSRAQEHCKDKPLGWSLDIFRHPNVIAALGSDTSAVALYLALRDARMRVHDDHCDHVVGLIGEQLALECYSLPNYKSRSQIWRQRIHE